MRNFPPIWIVASLHWNMIMCIIWLKNSQIWGWVHFIIHNLSRILSYFIVDFFIFYCILCYVIVLIFWVSVLCKSIVVCMIWTIFFIFFTHTLFGWLTMNVMFLFIAIVSFIVSFIFFFSLQSMVVSTLWRKLNSTWTSVSTDNIILSYVRNMRT